MNESDLDKSQGQKTKRRLRPATGFWAAALMGGAGALLSAEMSTLFWMLFPPPQSRPPPLTCRGVQSEAEPWQWLQLHSWSCSEARTAWTQERGFSTTEQIPPLIRNALGRKNPSQSATGLDMANNFSLRFLEEYVPGFLPTAYSKYDFPFVSKKNWQQ